MTKGAGNAGCGAAPAGLRVQCAQESAHTSIQEQRRQSDIPCAMALRLISRSPRRRIRLVTVASGLSIYRKPGWAEHVSVRLDISNGCQDHTVLPYAATSFVLRP